MAANSLTDYLGTVLHPFALVDHRCPPSRSAKIVVCPRTVDRLDWVLYVATGIFVTDVAAHYFF